MENNTPRPERCETCRFWTDGDCRRFPPVLNFNYGLIEGIELVLKGVTAAEECCDMTAESVWPTTTATEWCGEWKPLPVA